MEINNIVYFSLINAYMCLNLIRQSNLLHSRNYTDITWLSLYSSIYNEIFLCLCLVAKKVQESLTMFLKFSFLPLKFEKVIFYNLKMIMWHFKIYYYYFTSYVSINYANCAWCVPHKHFFDIELIVGTKLIISWK